MKLGPLAVDGAFVVEGEAATDERGSFTRTFCATELAAAGLDVRVAQCSVSSNLRRGTLRGLHLQLGASAEAKLVRCTAGAAFDVLVDVRPGSPTFLAWCGVELAAGEPRSVYAPPGVAHGFLTLVDATELAYQISVPHDPAAAAGFRWDDPAFGVRWPFPPAVLSARDAAWPLVDPAALAVTAPAAAPVGAGA